MQHLSTDRLAALGDEQPSPDEATHLATCATCAREHAAYRSLVAMAHAEQGAIGLPLTRWDDLASVYRAEVPARAAEAARSSAHAIGVASPRRMTRWPMQAAAGLLLLAGGAMLGRASTGASFLPASGSSETVATTGATTGTPDVLPASDSIFTSVADARAAQQRYELLYQQAAAFLAQHDSAALGQGNPVAYRSRLAALDRVISTTRDAMRDAPHDPVINGYYLTTLGQREATLRQLNTALPVSLRLDSY
ncbi:MAG TPA: hypothetical protein VFY85_01825 [Gemmatimonadaceae bacterium]|nr:hypothetical protein [Gemmatimonadaceae bacterium]